MAEKITDSQEVTQFRTVATAFCNLVRRPQSVEKAAFFTKLEKLLPLLCYAVQVNPPIEENLNYSGKWPHTTWRRLFDNLRNYLGKYDSYCHVYDPYNPDDIEPIIGSLTDDLADICRDLSPGLIAWRSAGTVKRRAIIDNWSISYRTHWGSHAARAWIAIHWLVHNHYVGADDKNFKGHRQSGLGKK
jgi:hypothetical protein